MSGAARMSIKRAAGAKNASRVSSLWDEMNCRSNHQAAGIGEDSV